MVLLIAGPTASGKSALALALAEAVGGEIINADSQQVYRELRILTARPTVTEEARVPHHLYGFVGVREGFSVGSWLRCAQGVLDDIRARGTRAIFVGGTGLYFSCSRWGGWPVFRLFLRLCGCRCAAAWHRRVPRSCMKSSSV